MDFNWNRAMEECVYLANKLCTGLGQDRDQIQRCLRGEILDEYLKASELAAEKAAKIKRGLLQL